MIPCSWISDVSGKKFYPRTHCFHHLNYKQNRNFKPQSLSFAIFKPSSLSLTMIVCVCKGFGDFIRGSITIHKTLANAGIISQVVINMIWSSSLSVCCPLLVPYDELIMGIGHYSCGHHRLQASLLNHHFLQFAFFGLYFCDKYMLTGGLFEHAYGAPGKPFPSV